MATHTIHLEIVSPEGVTYTGEIDELIINTTQGEIAILPHHANLFTKLAEGEAVIKSHGKETSVLITGGFLEIQNNKVSVISDYAVTAESVELAKIESAKKRAEEILSGKIANEDFTLAEKELQRSILALKVAEKMRKRHRA